jgi:hypothetical protein
VQPITVEELSNAVKSLQFGRNSGPEGYPAEFNKRFLSKIAPILIEMNSEAFVNGVLPQTLTQATICLILKKTKTLLSYHPNSLLNVDYKIRAKFLATRQKSLRIKQNLLNIDTHSSIIDDYLILYVILLSPMPLKPLYPWMWRKRLTGWNGSTFFTL